MNNNYWVYIITNTHNNVFYVGSTGDLKKRIYFHKNRLIPGFSKKYNLSKLVYFELCADEINALKRENQIKAGPRLKKIKLIESMPNPWHDQLEQIN